MAVTCMTGYSNTVYHPFSALQLTPILILPLHRQQIIDFASRSVYKDQPLAHRQLIPPPDVPGLGKDGVHFLRIPLLKLPLHSSPLFPLPSLPHHSTFHLITHPQVAYVVSKSVSVQKKAIAQLPRYPIPRPNLNALPGLEGPEIWCY